jgi:hypothetical protein
VSILDGSGRALAIQVQPLQPALGAQDVVLAAAVDGGVPDAESHQAGVQTFWSNWCGKWSGAGTLVVTLPALGTLRAAISDLSAPRCDASDQPSVLVVGPVAQPN